MLVLLILNSLHLQIDFPFTANPHVHAQTFNAEIRIHFDELKNELNTTLYHH